MVEQEAVNFEVAGSSPVPGAIQVKIAQIGHFFLLARQVDALRKNKIPSWAILILNGGSSGLGENQRSWFARRRRRTKIPDFDLGFFEPTPGGRLLR